jgi:threonylcarbamoyladenosine tRNA methylthiotransferase MtaB
MTPTQPTVAFKTVGCRLNQAETARIASQFEAAGYRVVPFGRPCDVAVIHTCAVTRHAEKTCARLARSLKKSSPPPLVVLAGCAAEAGDHDQLRETGADLIVGQGQKFGLPDVLCSRFRNRLGLAEPTPVASRLPRFDATRALVKAQDGCDFRCRYCIVPLARGAPQSRPVAEVIREIRDLAHAGFREVTITGANLGAYRDGESRLIDLLRHAEDIHGIARIRLSSIEVTTTERVIIDYMTTSAKLCRYLHIPMQSGDDRILASMGRRYTSRDFRNLIEYAAARLSDLGLGTDVLVGFPGEDDTAFDNTLSLIQSLPFNNLHVFPYSRRPGTPASTMPGQVVESVKKARARRVIDVGETKRLAFARSFIGRTVSVLIEEVSPKGLGSGWTSEYVEAAIARPGLERNQIVVFVPSRIEDNRLISLA